MQSKICIWSDYNSEEEISFGDIIGKLPSSISLSNIKIEVETIKYEGNYTRIFVYGTEKEIELIKEQKYFDHLF